MVISTLILTGINKDPEQHPLLDINSENEDWPELIPGSQYNKPPYILKQPDIDFSTVPLSY